MLKEISTELTDQQNTQTMKIEFYTSQCNPRIDIAQNSRLININDSGVCINAKLHWNFDENTWTIGYHVRRVCPGLFGGITNDFGIFDDLGKAVEVACTKAGIKSTDPLWRQRKAALDKIEKAKEGLVLIRKVLGDVGPAAISEIEDMLKSQVRNVLATGGELK